MTNIKDKLLYLPFREDRLDREVIEEYKNDISGISNADLFRWLERGFSFLITDIDSYIFELKNTENIREIEYNPDWVPCNYRLSINPEVLLKLRQVAEDLSSLLTSIDLKKNIYNNYFLKSVAEEITCYFAIDFLFDIANDFEDKMDEKISNFFYILQETFFKDTDFLMLYDPVLDGIEKDTEMIDCCGLTNLEIDKWFEPFNVGNYRIVYK